jgi:hypothetical protein
MAIIGTLPNNIQNGQAVDANPVMADFNFIVNQVNANANPIGTFTAPSGTAMPFQQNFAPTGWVAQTGAGYFDAFLRVITPAGWVAPAGTNGASNLIFGPITGDPHTLTVGEIPSHTHIDSGHTHTDAGHIHTQNPNTYYGLAGGTVFTTSGGTNIIENAIPQNTATSFASIQTSTANLQNTGGGGGHSHTLTPNSKFVDHIVAVKT